MMKKKVFIIVLAILVIGSVTALGVVGVNYIQNRAMEEESAELLTFAAESGARRAENSPETVQAQISGTEETDLRRLMRSKGYYEDDIAIAAAKFADIFVFDNMTAAEYDYIISLVKLEYDPQKLASIYRFLLLTPDDITIMREIYDMGILFSDERFWIENAYEMVKGTGDSTLSYEEVDAYVKSGITTDEIVLCYQMSLKGTKEIRQILDEKKNGASWPQICEQVYGRDEFDAAKFDAETDLRSLQTMIMLAGKTGSKTKDIIEKDGSGIPQVKQQILEKFDEKSMRVKAIQKSLDADPNDTEKFKQVIKENAGGISDEAAEKLAQEGYRAKEVKKALSGESADETSVKIREIINTVNRGTEQP